MTWVIIGYAGIGVGLWGLALLRMAASSEQEAILFRKLAGLHFCGTCEWEGDINDCDGEASRYVAGSCSSIKGTRSLAGFGHSPARGNA